MPSCPHASSWFGLGVLDQGSGLLHERLSDHPIIPTGLKIAALHSRQLRFCDLDGSGQQTLVSGLNNPEAITLVPLLGDANRDGKVDFSNLLVLAQNYGRTAAEVLKDRGAEASGQMSGCRRLRSGSLRALGVSAVNPPRTTAGWAMSHATI